MHQDAKLGTRASLRRSTRLTFSVLLTVTGRDVQGNPFTEQTHTITVNRQGGKILLKRQVELKDSLLVTNPQLKRTVNAVVAWVGKPGKPGDPWEVGIELLEPQNIWGLDFPPDDWSEALPTGKAAQDAGVSSSGLAIPVAERTLQPKSSEPAEKTVPPIAVVVPADTPLAGRTRPGLVAAMPAEKPPLPMPKVEKAPASKGASHAGDGQVSNRAPTLPAESIDNLVQTTLAGFEEELKRMTDTHVRVFERRLFEIGMKHVEEVRKRSQEAGLGTVQGSLAELRRQAQQDLENYAASLEEIRKHFQESAPDMVRECLVQLRRQAAQDLEKVGTQLDELKRQTITDALSELRRRLADVLKKLEE